MTNPSTPDEKDAPATRTVMTCPWCGSHAEPVSSADYPDVVAAMTTKPHLNPLMCPDCQGVGERLDWDPQPEAEND